MRKTSRSSARCHALAACRPGLRLSPGRRMDTGARNETPVSGCEGREPVSASLLASHERSKVRAGALASAGGQT